MGLLPLADEQAEILLASVPEEERTECWWLVLRDGTLVRGDRGGGVLLLSQLRLTRPLGRLLNGLRLSPAVDFADGVLDKLRGHIGWLVPEGPAPRRYP